MDGVVFPSTGLFDVALNIASVIILFGPAYLANTGAMLFGKWIPDLFGVGNHKIDSGKIGMTGIGLWETASPGRV